MAKGAIFRPTLPSSKTRSVQSWSRRVFFLDHLPVLSLTLSPKTSKKGHFSGLFSVFGPNLEGGVKN